MTQVERAHTARSWGTPPRRSHKNQRSPALTVQPHGEVAQGLSARPWAGYSLLIPCTSSCFMPAFGSCSLTVTAVLCLLQLWILCDLIACLLGANWLTHRDLFPNSWERNSDWLAWVRCPPLAPLAVCDGGGRWHEMWAAPSGEA